ncbi:Peptidase M14 carboxypeptidase A [Trinorchestia longiramus]|nr:Peptidase M14 carboxypeptidase A [Trinorchestia longiramus]
MHLRLKISLCLATLFVFGIRESVCLPGASQVDLQLIYERYGRKPGDTWLSVLDDSYFEGRYSGWKMLFMCCGSEDVIERHLMHWIEDGVVSVAAEGPAGSADIAVAPPVADEVLEKMTELGYTVTVMDHDLEKTIMDTFSRGRQTGRLTENFLQLEEIEDYLKEVQKKHPDQVKLSIIGESVQKRPIMQLSIVSKGSLKKEEEQSPEISSLPVIFLDAGMHAREWLSTATALYLIESLLEDPEATKGVEWRIVPVVNPDGYLYTWRKDRMWRKNRRSIDFNRCVGVDLNRNFKVDFGGAGASPYACSDEFRGEAAFSEPETQAIRKAVTDMGDRLKAFVSLHSYRQSILLPWSHAPSSHDNVQNMTNLAHGIAKEISNSRGTQFDVDSAWFNLYPASGTSLDWVAGEGVPYTYIIELQDQGEHGFLWPESEIFPAVNESYAGFRFLSKMIRKEFSSKEFISEDDEAISLKSVELPVERDPTTENPLVIFLEIYDQILTENNEISKNLSEISLEVVNGTEGIKISELNRTATPSVVEQTGILNIDVEKNETAGSSLAEGIVIEVLNQASKNESEISASKTTLRERQPVLNTGIIYPTSTQYEHSLGVENSPPKADECAGDVDCKVSALIKSMLDKGQSTNDE